MCCRVTSGGMIYHDIDLFYQHVDGEDAVGLNFTLTNIPTAFISGVTIERQVSGVEKEGERVWQFRK